MHTPLTEAMAYYICRQNFEMASIFTLRKATIAIAFFVALSSCKNKNGDAGKSNADSTKKATSASQTGPGSTITLDNSKRYIYLTWDDAPQPPGTTNCRRVFAQQGVKATFFVVGFNNVGPFKNRVLDTLRNSYPEFLVANHSFTHGFQNNYKKFYQMPDSAVQDFKKNEEELKIPVKIIRLPGNTSWVGKGEMKGPKSTMPVCQKLNDLGYNVIGWDLEWQFKGGGEPIQGADEMVRQVNKVFDNGTTNEQNAIVILAHDRMFQKPQYTDSLTKFISTLKQDPRNVFETIDHYPLVMRK